MPCIQTCASTKMQDEGSGDGGVSGTGVQFAADPMPTEQGSSPELKSVGNKAAHPSPKGLPGKIALPGRSWLHPSCRTICYFCQRATRHKYRFLNIFYELTWWPLDTSSLNHKKPDSPFQKLHPPVSQIDLGACSYMAERAPLCWGEKKKNQWPVVFELPWRWMKQSPGGLFCLVLWHLFPCAL